MRVKYHSVWEPLNLLYLASYVRRNVPLIHIKILDGYFVSDNVLLSEASRSDVVGISASTPQLHAALDIAKKIKQENPDTKIVFGGYGPSYQPRRCVKPYIDHVVIGEGEEALRRIIVGEEHKHFVSLEPIKNIDSIPFPARDLVDLERYIRIAVKEEGRRVTSLLSARGCPANCLFCAEGYGLAWNRAVYDQGRYVRVGPKSVRLRRPLLVVEEMLHIRDKYLLDFIKFSDAETNPTKKHFVDLCKEIVSQRLDTPWGCNMRADKVDEEVAKWAEKAGCVEWWIGVESGSDKILQHLNKDITVDQTRNTFRFAKKHGIKTRANLFLGSDLESLDTVKETETLLDEIDPDLVAIAILMPYPGTAYYSAFVKKHPEVDWTKMDNYGNPYRRSHYMSNVELRGEQIRLLEKYGGKLPPIIDKKMAEGIIK